MVSRAVRSSLILLIFSVFPPNLWAHDLITSKSFYTDQGGGMSFDEVQPQAFHEFPEGGILNLGYLKFPLWIRLRIDPADAPKDSLMVLSVRPSFLDRVELFDPTYQSLGQMVSGDETLNTHQPYVSLNLNYLLPAGPEVRDIWLKITSTSSILVDVQVLLLNESLKVDRLEQAKYVGYLAVIFIFMLWGLLYYLSHKDRAIGLFAVNQFVGLVFMAGLIGFYQGVWPFYALCSSGTFTDYLWGLYILSCLLLDYSIISEAMPNPYLLRILKLSFIHFPIYIIMMVLGHRQEAFQASMDFIFLGTLLYLILALTIPSSENIPETKKPLLSRRALILLYTSIFLSLSLSTLPFIGIFPASFIVFDGLLLYSLLSGSAFMIVLQLRIREDTRRKRNLEFSYMDAERRAAEEKKRREEQAEFLAMLTHELRTSLSVVSMVLGAKNQTPQLKSAAEKSIREMGEVIQRCLNVDQHEAGQMIVNPVSCELKVLLEEIVSCSSQPGKVILKADSDLTPITDVFLLRIILANLIDNAIKYSPKKSYVEIDASEKTPGAELFRISIINIAGIAGHPDSEKLFQKYYRSPGAHAFTGTGLGLFLSAQIARRLGGKLQYDPLPNKVRFTLCLPRLPLR